MKNLFSITLIGCVCLLVSTGLQAQASDPVITNVEKSLKIGSAKELVKNFEGQVDLSIEGEATSLSKTAAEEKLRMFFKNHPVASFRYIHHGGSGQGGLKYAIGKYASTSASYRVLIRFKDVGGKLAVYNISFTRE